MAKETDLLCGVDGASLRQVMGRFTTGVAIVTTRDATGDHGMTVNSLTSVSLDPPLVLCCLSSGSRTAHAVRTVGRFVINLMARDQMLLSNRFARRGEDHFDEVAVHREADDLPVITGGIGYLICAVTEIREGGDHVIVVGLVQSCSAGEGEPLVFFRGRYVREVRDDSPHPAPTWWA